MSYAAAVEPLRAAANLSGETAVSLVARGAGGGPVAALERRRHRARLRRGLPPTPTCVFVCAGGNPSTFDDRAHLRLAALARRGVARSAAFPAGPTCWPRPGSLDGRRATLHWEHAAAFHEAFPDVDVVPSLFVLDGDRITCSGGVSALDMMVALIARDHGRDLAAAVGEWFLLTHIREGMGPQRMDLRHRLGVTDEGCSPYSRRWRPNSSRRSRARSLPASPASRSASSSACSRPASAASIHAHYLSLRLDRARQLLRETALPVLEVAIATGFGSASQFSRAFARYTFAQSRDRG